MPSWRRRSIDDADLVIAGSSGAGLARVPAAVRVQMQYLCARVDLHDSGLPPNVVVTSALPGEGVTFIARALSAVLSEDLGRRTCLVHAGRLDDEDDPVAQHPSSLVDVVQGHVPIEDALVATQFARLWLARTGTQAEFPGHALPTTALVSGMLDQLRPRFDHVILDVPATTISAEAMTFAAAADASLLVARQRTTRIDQIEQAASDLRHTRLLGVVLNDNRLSMPKVLQRRLIDA